MAKIRGWEWWCDNKINGGGIKKCDHPFAKMSKLLLLYHPKKCKLNEIDPPVMMMMWKSNISFEIYARINDWVDLIFLVLIMGIKLKT